LASISFPRFFKVIHKVLEIIQPLEPEAQIEATVEPTVRANSFSIKTETGLHQIDFKDIAYLQSYGNNARVCLSNGVSYLTHNSTKELEVQLPRSEFFRVHKSYILQLSCITRIDGGRVFLGNTELPVGAIYRKEFMQRIS
jgi:DNA-binding LytR/AlgR family response regulator